MQTHSKSQIVKDYKLFIKVQSQLSPSLATSRQFPLRSILKRSMDERISTKDQRIGKMALLDLPSEIIRNIIVFLPDPDPTSLRLLHEQPSQYFLESASHPLKDFSLTCHLLREICSVNLFRFIKVNLESTQELLTFLHKNDLRRRVVSVVLHSVGLRGQGSGPPKGRSVTLPIRAIMKHINPATLIMMLPPASFDYTIPYDLNLEHEWAFNINFQILRLEQNVTGPVCAEESGDVTISDSNLKNLDFDILEFRPWTRIALNEGSSIPVYSVYEYFHKYTPSPLRPSILSLESLVPQSRLKYVTSFEYISIFPVSSNHRMADIYQSLEQMESLQYLGLRFAPTASNAVLDDAEAMGKCQRSDLWAELQGCYMSLFVGVKLDWYPRLSRLNVRDYETYQPVEELDDLIRDGLVGWQHAGSGVWKKGSAAEDFDEK